MLAGHHLAEDEPRCKMSSWREMDVHLRCRKELGHGDVSASPLPSPPLRSYAKTRIGWPQARIWQRLELEMTGRTPEIRAKTQRISLTLP